MHVFEMIVWIVGLSMVGGVLIAYFESKKSNKSGDAFDDLMNDLGLGEYYSKSDLDVYVQKIEAMEQRIQVLERIATDKGVTLASEIDNLK